MSWEWRGNCKIIRKYAVNPFSIYMSNNCDSCLSSGIDGQLKSTVAAQPLKSFLFRRNHYVYKNSLPQGITKQCPCTPICWNAWPLQLHTDFSLHPELNHVLFHAYSQSGLYQSLQKYQYRYYTEIFRKNKWILFTLTFLKSQDIYACAGYT